MTLQDTLTRLKELEAKATQGQWLKYPRQSGRIICLEDDTFIGDAASQDDVRLIIESRNAHPKLIAALEIAMDALQERNAEDMRRGIDRDRTGLALYGHNALEKINALFEDKK